MLETVSRNLKEVIKLIFFTLDMPRYFLDKQETNLHTKFCQIFCMHACMRLRIPTRGCHLYIMIDLNTFFSSMDAVIRRNILQRYDRGVSLTLLVLIRLRDHSNLHLLSVSNDACIYDIDLSTKLLSYILIPIVIGSFYLSIYKTFYNLKPSFLLGI